MWLRVNLKKWPPNKHVVFKGEGTACSEYSNYFVETPESPWLGAYK
jgi:hypothetical protein